MVLDSRNQLNNYFVATVGCLRRNHTHPIAINVHISNHYINKWPMETKWLSVLSGPYNHVDYYKLYTSSPTIIIMIIKLLII